MRKLVNKLLLLSILTVFLAACEKEDSVKFTDITIDVNLPSEYTGSKEGIVVEWENIASKSKGEVTTDANGKATVKVEEGNYNFYASKKVNAVLFQGRKDNENITGLNANVAITLESSYVSDSWVIKEVYYTGSKTPEDKSYFKDQYIEIYNNSRKTLYADGLIFCKTYDITATTNHWGAYFEKNQIVPGFIFQIPGNGSKYPVAPGKSIILANQGLNHKIDNPQSPVDLSKADFEWYEDHRLDVDVPEVPNLIKHYSSSASISILHTRGYQGYFILQISVNKTQAFLNAHPASTVYPNGKTIESYAIPHDYIIDAVQCGEPKGLTSSVFTTSLDAGYTYCDGAWIAKCVQRKFKEDDNGRAVLQDTNNSTNDFKPNATLSPRVVVK